MGSMSMCLRVYKRLALLDAHKTSPVPLLKLLHAPTCATSFTSLTGPILPGARACVLVLPSLSFIGLVLLVLEFMVIMIVAKMVKSSKRTPMGAQLGHSFSFLTRCVCL